MNWPLVVLTVLVCGPNVGPVRAADDAAVNIGSERQLFVDGFLLEKLDGARLELHRPIRRDIVIRNDHPWEKYGVSYMVTFRVGT